MKELNQNANGTPLSYHQERIAFIDEFEYKNVYSSHPVYHNIPLIIKLKGSIASHLLEQAFIHLIERHEVFRTRLGKQKGIKFQKVSEQSQFFLETNEHQILNEDEVLQQCLKKIEQTFSLTDDSLMRATLFTNKKQGLSYLTIICHHFIADRQTLKVIYKELLQIYEKLRLNQPVDFPEPELHYIDFSEWQRELPAEEIDKMFVYWQNYLRHKPKQLDLPMEQARPGMHVFKSELVEAVVPVQLYQSLEKHSKHYQVNNKSVISTAFALLINQYTDEQNIYFGFSQDLRETDCIDTSGPISNLMVMLFEIENRPLNELVKSTFKSHLSGEEYKNLPFDMLVKKLKPEKDMSRTALFDVLLTFDELPYQPYSGESLQVDVIETNLGYGKYDFHLLIQQKADDSIGLHLVYNALYYSKNYAQQLLDNFVKILDTIIKNPNIYPDKINLLSEQECRTQLRLCQPEDISYPRQLDIATRFEQMVDKYPENIAVRCKEQALTYSQLDKKANQLAHFLKQQDLKKDDLAGLCLSPSVDSIVTMLACLKAGAGYLPLDPQLPQNRLKYILEDACCRLILCDDESFIEKQLTQKTTINLKNFEWNSYSKERLNLEITSDSIAYCIYTSGTTGKPKGVLIEHRNVIRLLINESLPFEFDHKDVWTVFHNLNFDFSVWEIYGALFYGGCAVIVDPYVKRDTNELLELIERDKITVFNQTPSSFYNLSNKYLANSKRELSLRYIIFGGEALNPIRLQQWHARHSECHFVNMYGITETTVHVSYKMLTEKDLNVSRSIIGHPIPTTGWYIFDQKLRPVTPGLSGELYIFGEGLARGYLNRPELTAERFIDNPWKPGERLYRTGDKARFTEDGEVVYLGRFDSQVQIRGFRIELDEIRSVLLNVSEIKDVALIVTDEYIGEKEIIAYLITESEQDKAELRAEIVKYLPEYMIPSVFVDLNELPLTSNGKLDSSSLPDPTDWRGNEHQYIAPVSKAEHHLVKIWQQKLKLNQVGITSNFFDLGGHSLLATSINAEIFEHYKVEIPIRIFFENPTIKYLAHWLEQQSETAHKIPAFERNDQVNELPLSFSQKRLWFINQLANGTPEYNMVAPMRIKGSLDIDSFREAFYRIIQRHSTLRSMFINQDGEAKVFIQPLTKPDIQINDLTNEENIEQKIELYINNECNLVFDLSKDVLIRLRILQLSDEENLIIFNVHHIIFDGWSINLLLNEFALHYEAAKSNRTTELPELPIQFHDYAIWQQKYLQGKHLDKLVNYWSKQLIDYPPVHSLPLDRGRSSFVSTEGGQLEYSINTSLASSLMHLAKQRKASIFMLIHAVFSLLLERHSNMQDIVIGTPIANRNYAGLENLIGYFVNTLVLRTSSQGKVLFTDYLDYVCKVNFEAQSHQDLPFELLVEKLKVPRDTSYNPIYQILLTIDHAEKTQPALDGLEIFMEPSNQALTKFELMLDVKIDEKGGVLGWTYNRQLFDSKTIEIFNQHFVSLLQAVTEQPEQKTSDLPLLSNVETKHLLYTLNDTKIDFPHKQCIHHLFELQAKKNPNVTAIIFKEEKLSYNELNQRANQLAHNLIEQGIGRESLVGLCVERSFDMVVGIIGILKAGGAYVPLDPAYPEDLIEFMLNDSGVNIIVTQQRLCNRLPTAHQKLVILDEKDVLTGYSHHNPTLSYSTNSQQLAYIIYTSGSTGKPKGVMCAHRGLVNIASDRAKFAGIVSHDRVMHTFSINFDPATMVIWITLFNSATLVIAEHLNRFDRLVEEPELINHILTTPAMLELMEPEDYPAVRYVMVCGDVCPLSLAQKWSVNALFSNEYGPTETTVISTVGYFKPGDDSINIGRPVANTQVYVLSNERQLLPFGTTGEMYIGGAGVARGYLNQNKLTNERFVDNDFYNADDITSSKKLYRTGDLVRWLPHGELEFIGRVDQQVKIRGFRVEPGEIETKLLSQQGVREAVVLVRQNNNHGKQLIAYVQLDSVNLTIGQTISDRVSLLKQQLSRHLPKHMVPAYFIVVKKWPLTPNGKINKNELLKLKIEFNSSEHVEPSNQIERLLVNIWAEQLNIKPQQVSVSSNFFDMGGHSLMVLQVLARIEREFDFRLPVLSLFSNPTIRQLALLLEEKQISKSGYSLLSSAKSNKRQKLFFAPALGMPVLKYRSMAESLSQYFEVVLLTTPGIDVPLPENKSSENAPCMTELKLRERAELWLEQILLQQDSGTYKLSGHSFGGCVAMDIANLLEQRGKKVELVLIESVLGCSSLNHKPVNLDKYSIPADLEQTIASDYRLAVEGQLKLQQNYQPIDKLSGQICLIQAEQGLQQHEDILKIIEHIQDCCQQPLKIRTTLGDHLSVIDSSDFQKVLLQVYEVNDIDESNQTSYDVLVTQD